MTDEAIIQGEYVTFKHVKTRKVVVLEVEVPEELFQDVISKLGMPIGGEAKPVAVCLLNCEAENHIVKPKITTEKSEGEKLRQRACILCGEEGFQEYCAHLDKIAPHFFGPQKKAHAREVILRVCNITSRSELTTNKDAQGKFLSLMEQFNNWKRDKEYEDNFSRG